MEIIFEICANSYAKWFEFGFLFIGMPLVVLLIPIIRLVEWKRDCKKHGKETAEEIWKRYH